MLHLRVGVADHLYPLIGTAARRSPLPRERFSPLALLRSADRLWNCPFIGVDRKSSAHRQNGAFDPPPTSPLRHPGHAHTLIDALAFGEKSRIVARCASAVASYGEVWVDRKSRLGGGPRLTHLSQQREGSGEPEMHKGGISVGLDALAEP